MNQSTSLKFLALLAFSAILLLARGTPVGAHAGHKHEDEPTIALPKVLAKVNGTDIQKDDIWEDLKRNIKRIKSRGLPLSSDQEKRAAKQLLNDEIDRTLMLQKAQGLGLSVPSGDIDKKVDDVRKKFKSEKSFLQRLKQRNLTPESYRAQLQNDMLVSALLDREIGSKIQVTDAQLEAYFNANKAKFLRKEQRRASVILIKVPGKDLEKETQAREVLAKVKNKLGKGQNFADLAREFSQDSLAKRGGDLGYLTEDHMYKPFAEKAFQMKVGEVSDVFRSQHGLHLLMLNDIREGSKGGFAGEKENVRKAYVQQEIKKQKKSYLEALRKEAKVKLYF